MDLEFWAFRARCDIVREDWQKCLMVSKTMHCIYNNHAFAIEEGASLGI